MANKKKPITFEKILNELKKLSQQAYDAWEYCSIEETYISDETERVWMQADKGRYSHINDELELIIATLENWLML